MDGVATEIRYLRVTNRNPYPLVDRYDNRIYEFPEGETKTIPLEAGMHMFGYSPTATEESVKLHCLKRYGMNRPEVLASQQHELFWANLEIVPVSMRLVEVEEDDVEEEAAPVEDEEPERIARRVPKKRRGRYGPRKRVLTPKDDGLRHPLDDPQPELPPAA